MINLLNHTIKALSESALLIDFGNIIEEEINQLVLQIAESLEADPVEGMIEVVPAYSSLAVYYDFLSVKDKMIDEGSVFEKIKTQIEQKLRDVHLTKPVPLPLIRIPVCYEREYAPDLEAVAELKHLASNQVVDLHTSQTYRVYMIGFLPGYPYMGKVKKEIEVPRKNNPANVPAGSVAIAGRQTGIYPMNSPGGWHIIGRTPINLFLPDQMPPALLKAGDQVQFYPISYDEFKNYQSGLPR